MGAKIRKAELQKIPLVAILGKREVESGQVAVRSRANGNEGPIATEAFLERLEAEVANRGGTT